MATHDHHVELPVVGQHHDSPNMIAFNDDSETEHMRNFKKISSDLKIYEEEYSECIKEIPMENYTEDKIDECIGANFIKVVLDIKYETLKIISRGDMKVRKFFIEHCYVPAGINEIFSMACDLMERDTLDMMWNGLDFVELLEMNKLKYIQEYGKIPYTNFKDIIELLDNFSKEFFELLDEVDSHKEVTILRLKTLIDDRTKLIIEEAKKHPDTIIPARIKHHIEITESIQNNNYIDTDHLPHPHIENTNPEQFHLEMPAAPGFERELKQTSQTRPGVPNLLSPQEKEAILYKNSSLRTFNGGQRYSGLNRQQGSTRNQKLNIPKRDENRPRIIGGIRIARAFSRVQGKAEPSTHSERTQAA